jgi:subtilisin family serine protease/subtilisin-like proprotein convertase family protein
VVLALVAASLVVPTSPALAAPPIRNSGGTGAVPGSYLVVLKSPDAVQVTSKSLTKRFGGRVGRTFEHATRGFELSGAAAVAKRMAADPTVAYVEQNHRFRITDTQTPTPSWGLDRIDQRSSTLDQSYTYPTSAGNVRAYVIDTGIRTTHTEFGGRAQSGFDAIDGGTADDCNGHGTHVAGTIGGSTYGVAKAVALVAVRVLDCDGSGTTATVVAGLDWVIADHAAGVPAVANMSLGGDADQAIDDAVAGAIADGVSVTVSAGNEDTDACTRSPARAPAAITVGATGSFIDVSDSRADFSDYGTCVDLFAPGVDIESAFNDSDTATESLSGTSMASPHVAGAAALILSEHPAYTPAQVRNALVGNATTGVVEDPGTGSPDALLYIVNTPPENDFSASVTPTAGRVDPGTAITATVRTTTTAGAAQEVALTLSGLPAGVTATFTPASVTSGSTSTLRLTAAASATLGTYPLEIAGTGALASVTHRAEFGLTVNGPAGCAVTAGADVQIPDSSVVDSIIPIHGCAGSASPLSTVEVHIVHSFRGDLGVQLIAPDGTAYLLFDHSGGSADNLDLTTTLDLSGEVANGDWRLRVEDDFVIDTGYIDSWTLNLSSPPATPGCTGSHPGSLLIPDLATVNSAIVISGCARNGTATSSVTVHILHEYVGDLVITLVAPDGSTYLLQNQEGGSADNIDRTYPVNLSSEAANGVWRLRVADVFVVGDGYLNSWSLTL